MKKDKKKNSPEETKLKQRGVFITAKLSSSDVRDLRAFDEHLKKVRDNIGRGLFNAEGLVGPENVNRINAPSNSAEDISISVPPGVPHHLASHWLVQLKHSKPKATDPTQKRLTPVLPTREELHFVLPKFTVFDFIRMIVPRRLYDEEIGDAIESINARRLTGWRRGLVITCAVVWVVINAIREVASAFAGKKKGGG